MLPRLLPLVRPRGTIVLKTTTERPTAIDLSHLVVAEQRIVGSRCGRFAPALAVLADRKVDLRPMISASYGLDDGAAAFARASTHGTLKVLLEVS